MNGILAVEGLSLSVPTGHVIQGRKQVLNDVSFSVARGSAVAYIGPNGAGKTSTFRILCGLCRADVGRVVFAGDEM
ncbi:MAG: ATP-binding cassette domain-containing protein, partial [Mariprofundaceae bacterium]|nr:ATP-binding cassette domain-containing protein [Mariprofundaceae bacterium]